MRKNAWALIAVAVSLAVLILGWSSLGGFSDEGTAAVHHRRDDAGASPRLDIVFSNEMPLLEGGDRKQQHEDTVRLGKENYVVSFADYTEADGDVDVTNRTIVVPSVFSGLPILLDLASAISSAPVGTPATLQKSDKQSAKSDDPFKAYSPADDVEGTAAVVESSIPLYPSSIPAYKHPFGTCGKSDGHQGSHTASLIKLKYSNFTVGNGTDFVRVWPAYPDLRLSFPSEHERCHFVMARMLAIFTAVMKKFGLKTWFMSHATLLGAVRSGGFIPWDVDVDIAMPRSHITYLRRRWRREFPRDMFLQSEKTDTAFHMWNGKERAMRIKDRYSSFAGMRFSIQRGRKKYKQKRWHMGAHIDIIPMEKKNGGTRYKILHHYFSADDLFPLQDLCFENMMIPAPKNVHGFLTQIYGDSYMQPPQNVTFGGPTVLPCLATQHTRGSPWSLMFSEDHKNGSRPVVAPRSDPYGSYDSDLKTPYQLYYNSKW